MVFFLTNFRYNIANVFWVDLFSSHSIFQALIFFAAFEREIISQSVLTWLEIFSNFFGAISEMH